jgi:hypothetical protein
MEIQRLYRDNELDETTVRIVGHRSKEMLDGIHAITDESSVERNVYASSETTKIAYKKPVEANVEKTEEGNVLRIHDR